MQHPDTGIKGVDTVCNYSRYSTVGNLVQFAEFFLMGVPLSEAPEALAIHAACQWSGQRLLKVPGVLGEECLDLEQRAIDFRHVARFWERWTHFCKANEFRHQASDNFGMALMQ